jgi:hypothetical protein
MTGLASFVRGPLPTLAQPTCPQVAYQFQPGKLAGLDARGRRWETTDCDRMHGRPRRRQLWQEEE